MDGPSSKDSSSESVHELLETTLLDTERIQRKGRKACEQSAAIKAFQQSSEMTSPIATTTQQTMSQPPGISAPICTTNISTCISGPIGQPSCFPNSGVSQVTLTQSFPNTITSDVQFQPGSSANVNSNVLVQQHVTQASLIDCTRYSDNFSPNVASTYMSSQSQNQLTPHTQLDRIEDGNREIRYALSDMCRTLKEIRDRMNPSSFSNMPYYGYNHYNPYNSYAYSMVSGSHNNSITGSLYSNVGNTMNPNYPYNTINSVNPVRQQVSQIVPGAFYNPPPGFTNSAHVNAQSSVVPTQSPVPQSIPQPVQYEQPQTFASAQPQSQTMSYEYSQPSANEQQQPIYNIPTAQSTFTEQPSRNFDTQSNQPPMQSRSNPVNVTLNYSNNISNVTHVLDCTKPTSPYFEQFLWEQEQIFNDDNIQTQSLREQSVKIKQNILAGSQKVEPYKGFEDERSYPEFMEEFAELAAPMANSVTDRAHMLRKMIDKHSVPHIKFAPRKFSYNDLARFLQDIFWTREVQTKEYMKFHLVNFPEEEGQNVQQFCTRWITRMMHCELASDEMSVIRVLCSKLDPELTASVTGSGRKTYLQFLKEIQKAECTHDITEAISEAYKRKRLEFPRTGKQDRANTPRKKTSFLGSSSSTSSEVRGKSFNEMDLNQDASIRETTKH